MSRTGADGAPIQLVSTAISSPFVEGNLRHIVFDEHTLTALCTSELHYSAPQEITESGDTWTWLGPHCSDRFDFLQYRLVHKTGAIPANPADGTTVYTGTAATTSHVPLPGETYVAFADYNGRSGSTVDGSSDPEVGSILVK